MIIWKKMGASKVPEPKKGVDPDFDSCNEKVTLIRDELTSYLEDVKKDTKCKQVSLHETSVGKFRL